jgi:hypothetical protein
LEYFYNMQQFVKIILKLVPIFFPLLCTNCHKEEILPRDYPRINTLEVTDINNSGATFRAEFIYPGNSEISDHGFIWSTNEDLTLLNAEKISLGTASGKETFKATVTYSLIRDRVYFVKGFAVSDKYTVYGKVVKFKSSGCLPPEIFDVIPNHGFDGDTIKITGTNFSALPSNIKVMFGADQAEITEAGIDEIKFLVPVGYTNPGYITVNLLINGFQLEIKNFLLDTIKIETIYPQVAKIPNTEVEITCNTVIKNIQNLSLENFNVSTFQNADNKILLTIPPGSPVGYVRIKAVINSKNVVSEDSLLLLSPWVKKSYCPSDEEMDMTRKGFVINNIAYFYAYTWMTYSGRPGELWEYDPLTNSWNFCDIFPDVRSDPFAFAINEKGYMGAGWAIYPNDNHQYVFEFTPETRLWTQLSSFPTILDNPEGFSIEEYAYVFGGVNYFKYNQPSDNWIMIGTYEEIPGFSINGEFTGFEIDGKIYLGTGSNSNEFWCYNPSSDGWSKISDFPSEPRRCAIGFSINGNGYVGLGRSANNYNIELKDIWKYNSNNDTWEILANLPSVDNHRGNATALVIMGKAYVAYDHELWEFNPDF